MDSKTRRRLFPVKLRGFDLILTLFSVLLLLVTLFTLGTDAEIFASFFAAHMLCEAWVTLRYYAGIIKRIQVVPIVAFEFDMEADHGPQNSNSKPS